MRDSKIEDVKTLVAQKVTETHDDDLAIDPTRAKGDTRALLRGANRRRRKVKCLTLEANHRRWRLKCDRGFDRLNWLRCT